MAEQVTRRFANGLSFIQSYTYSHAIDNSTADFFTSVLTPRRTQDFQNLANDRSNSALDRRHRFTLALIYDVPYFKSGKLAEEERSRELGSWAHLYVPVAGVDDGSVRSRRERNGTRRATGPSSIRLA